MSLAPFNLPRWLDFLKHLIFSSGFEPSVWAACPPTAHAGGPEPTPLVKAIENRDPGLVSRVLAELSPAERKRELAAECAGSGGRQQQHDGTAVSSSSAAAAVVMLPVFHAASSGNVEVFLAVLGALKASLSENAVGLGSLTF